MTHAKNNRNHKEIKKKDFKKYWLYCVAVNFIAYWPNPKYQIRIGVDQGLLLSRKIDESPYRLHTLLPP
jgi:hypothetical protein